MDLAPGTTIRVRTPAPSVTPVYTSRGEKGDTGAAGGSDASFAAFVADPASATRASLSATYAGIPPLKTTAEGTSRGVPRLHVGRSALSYPEHLAATRAKLAAARYRPVNITCIGNSITEGQKAGDATNTDDLYRTRGWLGQLRSLFADRYGDPGEGVIQIGDARITQNGCQAIGSIGITRYTGGYRMNAATDWIELAAPQCTEIWVHGWWESDAKVPGPWSYTIDGGAAVQAAGFPTGTDQDYTIKITGLSDATHTIRLLGRDGYQIDIAGFTVLRKSASGVRFHRLAKGGGYIDNAFYLSTDAVNPRSYRLTYRRPETDLLILGFGANESSSTGGEPIGWTFAKYDLWLRDAVNVATNTYAQEVLLLSLTRRSASQEATYGQDAFYQLHETLAAENTRVAHFDMARIWGDNAAMVSAGLLQDTIHPNLLGHSDLAAALYDALNGL